MDNYFNINDLPFLHVYNNFNHFVISVTFWLKFGRADGKYFAY